MDMIIYLIGAIVVIYLFFSLLPLLLPLIILLVLALFIFIWYLKRKVKKQMGQFEDQYNTFSSDEYDGSSNSSHTYSSNNQNKQDDIIDVEFTETDESNPS